MAPSFVRFGFEHWYYRKKPDELKILADYVIDGFYAHLRAAAIPTRPCWPKCACTAELMAQWQAVGFMHGVMNTDNMSILGLTLDYGPFGFMEAFDADICNHTDQQGRYSYANQPQVGHWNCYALGQALLPLIGEVALAQAALDSYQPAFAAKMNALLRAKLGLQTSRRRHGPVRQHVCADASQSRGFHPVLPPLSTLQVAAPNTTRRCATCSSTAAFDAWAATYRAPAAEDRSMPSASGHERVNPKYVLRNYLAQVAIEKAQKRTTRKWRNCWTYCKSHLTNSPNTSTMRPCRRTGPAILKSAAHPKESL
jgi:uncharacterized protein YdiU (UPF0061 family)